MQAVVITKDLIAQHNLTDDEYKKIIEILGREPNITELGMFSVMWSEHCSYKSSRVHLKKLPTTGHRVVQGPGENAGAVDIGDGLCAVFKMESHNHPSFIEPYQGAATGVGGILRDIFTMGARPIALLDALRFGGLDNAKNRHLVKGVVSGIAGYGNCMGVPTVGGEIVFNDIYSQNPLVNVFCLGIAHKDKIFLGMAAGVGNPVIYFGSKTGRDGIHGATMASDSFDDQSEQKRPTVQVGDPFTEKLLLEACLELMAGDLLVGIQDMGAAGLTSSSCEMASRAGNGIDLDLTDVPRREPDMTPYELMLSESQERMLMVAEAGKEDECIRICKKWDLDVAVVGRVTGDGILRVRDQGKVVAEIPAKSLADDGPRYERPYSPPAYQDMLTNLNYDALPDVKDPNAALLSLLESPTIASKRWVYEQYDHMVRTNTMVRPGSDAAVVRIKGTNKAIAMTVDCNSRYCLLHPYEGARLAVSEAARNLVCSGAEPIGLTDCLNFGNPERPDIMWQFVLAIEGMKDACEHFKVPIVSGNVSFYNETNGLSIYPTPMLGMVGLIDAADQTMTQWFKRDGDAILLLGKTREDLGGSEYLKVLHHREQGSPPYLSLETEKALHDFILNVIREGLVQSAHDCSDGGLAVALVECCVSAPDDRRGAVVRLSLDTLRRDALLFGESQSRVVLSVKPEMADQVLNRAQDSGVPAVKIGTVGGDRFVIDVEKGQRTEGCRIDLPIDQLHDRWAYSIERCLEGLEARGQERFRHSFPLALCHLPHAKRIMQLITPDKFHDECAVFGIYGHKEAANLTYLGLYSLQHRGQEASGIVSGDGEQFHIHKGKGLVADIYNTHVLEQLTGSMAIGHNRYSTAGGNDLKNIQPLSVNFAFGNLALAHNGNLINAQVLRHELEAYGAIFQSTSDSEVIIHLIAHSRADTLLARIIDALSQVRGAFSVVLLTDDGIIAVRDPHGFRPLCLGRLGDSYLVASETCAFDLLGAEIVREIEPGELVVLNDKGVTSHKPFVPVSPAMCVFEYVYFARPDSKIFGANAVYATRKALGRQLAKESPVLADIVVPVPDSGVPAALGYAGGAGIQFELGLIRNHYVGRTFIEPEQSIRHFGVKVKLNAVPELLEGKRVVVVDDSLVRGTTSRKIVKMIRNAGAKEVHMRISSPPIISPCFYGIDTPTRKELIASSHSTEEIRKYITADSLAYLSLDGMLNAAPGTPGQYCNACFTERYPIPLTRAEEWQLGLFEPSI